MRAKVEFVYNDVTTGNDVTKIIEIPLSVQYKYIAKTINYGMLFALGLILILAWIFIRRRDERIEFLEEENIELEDERSVLERAKKEHITKKVIKKEPVKKVIKKTPTTKKVVKKDTETIKKETPKKTPTRKPKTDTTQV